MENAGFSFQSIPVNSSEFVDKKLNVDSQILSISRQKLEVFMKEFSHLTKDPAWIITADTEVVFQNQLMGKPLDISDAGRVLGLLSGNRHFVKTGIIIYDTEKKIEISHIETSIVYFKILTETDIQDYLETQESLDKAGSYAIQGQGSKLVSKYEGLFSNIVGLPIEKIIPYLK